MYRYCSGSLLGGHHYSRQKAATVTTNNSPTRVVREGLSHLYLNPGSQLVMSLFSPTIPWIDAGDQWSKARNPNPRPKHLVLSTRHDELRNGRSQSRGKINLSVGSASLSVRPKQMAPLSISQAKKLFSLSLGRKITSRNMAMPKSAALPGLRRFQLQQLTTVMKQMMLRLFLQPRTTTSDGRLTTMNKVLNRNTVIYFLRNWLCPSFRSK